MSKDEDTPRTRLLHTRRECDQGIEAAESHIEVCRAERWMQQYEDAYRNRQAWWLTCRDAVDRALAALPEEETHE